VPEVTGNARQLLIVDFLIETHFNPQGCSIINQQSPINNHQSTMSTIARSSDNLLLHA
jgi:hypothetical protein